MSHQALNDEQFGHYLVYPPGASQDPQAIPHGPQLVMGSHDMRKAKRVALKLGGTVERWAHGEPISEVR